MRPSSLIKETSQFTPGQLATAQPPAPFPSPGKPTAPPSPVPFPMANQPELQSQPIQSSTTTNQLQANQATAPPPPAPFPFPDQLTDTPSPVPFYMANHPELQNQPIDSSSTTNQLQVSQPTGPLPVPSPSTSTYPPSPVTESSSGFDGLGISTSQSNIIVIEEFESKYKRNDLFDRVESFLTHNCFPDSPTVKLSKPRNSNTVVWTIDPDRKIRDNFQGMTVTWTLRVCETEKKRQPKVVCGVPLCRPRRTRSRRLFELSFEKEYQSKVTSYIDWVKDEAAKIRGTSRDMNYWRVSVGLLHVIGSLVIQLLAMN